MSGDPTWSGLTAMTFHYQTQPIPAWTSWYAHHLPVWFHMVSVVVMLFIELVVPFFVFAPVRFRRLRAVACALMCLLQIGIATTGNYGFFTLLTVALYLTVLDDAVICHVVPRWLSARAASENYTPDPRLWRVTVVGAAAVIAFMSTLTVWHEATYTRPHPDWSNQITEPGETDALDQRLRAVPYHDDRATGDRGRGECRRDDVE